MLCNITGDNGNTAQLFWNAVDGASGYRIKMAHMDKVSAGGSEVWDNVNNILMDTTVYASATSLVIPNLDRHMWHRPPSTRICTVPMLLTALLLVNLT
ncbi:MAG: hypothetical protein IJT98_07320 [Prevotella sp.]|nr:hypothetical protein [Prevotella sp.]